jgi:hypothetical protein
VVVTKLKLIDNAMKNIAESPSKNQAPINLGFLPVFQNIAESPSKNQAPINLGFLPVFQNIQPELSSLPI